MIGIYIIRNLINGKRYIGQSTDIKRRFWDHRCISHEENKELREDLIKYGKDNFEYSVLEECDKLMLDEKERYYISNLNPEYNVSYGGQDSLRRYPPEVIAKISQKAKEQWEKMTDDEKLLRIKNNLKGPSKGHNVSFETRQKLKKANLGKKQSSETIQKRIQTFQKKKSNGWIRTNEHCKKKIICLETNEIFFSVKAAAEKINVHPSNISAVLHGRRKSVKGYHFNYYGV